MVVVDIVVVVVENVRQMDNRPVILSSAKHDRHRKNGAALAHAINGFRSS